MTFPEVKCTYFSVRRTPKFQMFCVVDLFSGNTRLCWISLIQAIPKLFILLCNFLQFLFLCECSVLTQRVKRPQPITKNIQNLLTCEVVCSHCVNQLDCQMVKDSNLSPGECNLLPRILPRGCVLQVGREPLISSPEILASA